MTDLKIKTGDKVTTVCQKPVTSELRLEATRDLYTYAIKHNTLHFECGALRFRIELSEGDLLSLLRGDALRPRTKFEPLVMVPAKQFKLMQGLITLDVETLGMVRNDS